jgi:ABC-type antimicrobial peptide transport system, ATPase component
MNYSLVTKGLTFSYTDTVKFQFPDITCEKGKHLLVMGSSGCGKTTLLHLLAGLLKPESGNISANGLDITSMPESLMDKYRGTEIGFVFQKPHFIQALTAIENLYLVPYLNHVKQKDEDIDSLLTKLNIEDKRNARINEMSQGELQRLSIARAIINNPSVILADEPTSSLDDANCEEVLQLLKLQADTTEASLIIVTHDKRLLTHFQNIITL